MIEMYDNVFQTLSNLSFYKVNTLAKRCHQIIFIIFLLFNALCHHVMASEITISWTGQIEGIAEFSDNSLPIGITVGDQVVGTFRFDQTTYEKSGNILGNISGKSFFYAKNLQQNVVIDEWNWILDSGTVSLVSSWYPFGGKTESLDVFSRWADGSFIKFPNFVGNYELGFALIDKNPPLDLFDSYLLDYTNFNLNEFTWGGGHISSREWNESRDIINGYYITFNIIEADISHVPIPASIWLFGSGVIGIFYNKKRKYKTHSYRDRTPHH